MKRIGITRKIMGRVIVGFCLLLVILIGTGYFLAVHRLKASVEYVVKKETGGKYEFHADKASLSLFNKTLYLKRVSLQCIDSAGLDQYYNVKVPEIFFSFTSWRELIFNQKLIVDSFSVVQPDIFLQVNHDTVDTTTKSSAFKTSDILDFLEKTLVHFNAHSIRIENLAFTYSKPQQAPLLVDHVSFEVVNFTKVDNNDRHVFGSDIVNLSLGRQNWKLPDGIHEISFKKFSFASSTQTVELDSFTFRQKVTAERPGLLLEGEKFYFNSSHLPTIYQKNELNIDTLYCVNPVLSLTQQTIVNNSTSTEAQKDSAAAAQALFRLIQIRFIDIVNGEFHLKSNETDSSISGLHKSNATVYNLVIDNENNESLTTDSVRVNLKDIQFYSSDSLTKLKIADFVLDGKDAFFRNVEYMPSEFNPYDRGVTFTSPQLLLKDISLSELLKHRLQAQSALLTSPSIRVISINNAKSKPVQLAPPPTEDKMLVLFRSLHHVKDLLNVETFEITGGKANYQTRGINPLLVDVKNINARFLLNKLFLSDSLVDVKHSIPDFRIGKLNLTGTGMQIQLSNYRLDGVNRRNWCDNLLLSAANGTEIKGKNIYWEVFDWDVFEKTNKIQVNRLKIGNAAINATAAKEKGEKTVAHKDLPAMSIAKLEVDNIGFQLSSTTNTIRFNGNQFTAENIGTSSHFFTWERARANLSNISASGVGHTVSIKNISLNTAAETIIHQLNFESNSEQSSTKISLPVITLGVNAHSTDISKLLLQSLHANKGSISLLSKISKEKSAPKPLKLPALSLNDLKLSDMLVRYSKMGAEDTTMLETTFNIKADGLRTFDSGEKMAAYKRIDVHVGSVDMDRENFQMNFPSSSLRLSSGLLQRNSKNKLQFTSAVDFETADAAFHYEKDSTSFTVKNFSAGFNDKSFHFIPGEKISWKDLAGYASSAGSDILYRGKKITAAAKRFNLDKDAEKLEIKDFSIVPNQSREETFATAKWQNDFMIIKGESLQVDRFIFNNTKTDSTLNISKIVADNIDLNTSRDKSIPFQHGIEKPMPTELIKKIAIPLRVDSVILVNSKVTYNEFSVATKRWSTLPISNINGSITNITNQYDRGDSLKLSLRADLFDNHIRHFVYKESYTDSLSGFSAKYQMSPVELTQFTGFSKPLAAVAITGGIADTVFAQWKGNKNVAFGKMDFHYRKLKVKVYNKKDTEKQGIKPAVETFVANLILPNKKDKTSVIYFERDKEKFVFNYWIKSQVSGILSTIGIKRDKKYIQRFRTNSNAHLLSD